LQQIGIALGHRLNIEVVQRDDTRQTGNTADEGGDIVVIALYHYANRQFDVELLFNFGLQGDGLELQTTVEPHLGDVLQQAGNLDIAGQLLEQGTGPVLDFDQLFQEGLQVGDLDGLVGNLLAQGDFLGIGTFELSLE